MDIIMMKDNTTKLFYLKKKVLFPHCSIDVSLRESKLSQKLEEGDKILTFPTEYFTDLIFLRKRIATIAEITEVNKDKKTVKLQLKGLSRVKLTKTRRFHHAEYELLDSGAEINKEIPNELRKKAQELIFLINVNESDRLIELLNFLVDASQISDFIANYFVLDYKSRLKLLNETNVLRRSTSILNKLNHLISKLGINRNNTLI